MKRVTVNDYARLLLAVTAVTAGSKLDGAVAQVLDLMRARGDASLAPRVPEAVERLSESSGDSAVKVATAVADDQIQPVIARAFHRREEEVHVTTDPRLIAGITVRVGHTVVDASLSGTLQRLSTHLSKS